MEIGKERAGAGAREDGMGMLTPEDAKELGLGPEAPEPYPCPHCGKPLGRRGITDAFEVFLDDVRPMHEFSATPRVSEL
jgi:hypothetical protein